MEHPEHQHDRPRWRFEGPHLVIALVFVILIVLAIFPELLIWSD